MTTRLYTFALSHYCEKARWALDWHGIPFQEVGWPPGLHMKLAKSIGAPGTSLPILDADGEIVQGSDRIFAWAENHGATDNTLTPDLDPAAAHDVEQRADDVIGVHVRRLYYSEVLPQRGHLARPWLLHRASPLHRVIGTAMWPRVRKLMIRFMDTTPEAAADSRARLETELDWVDGLVNAGQGNRRFLAGERFSRLDITLAALLAPFARPAESEIYPAMTLPPALAQDVERWRERPAMVWVRDTYRDFRKPAATR